MGNNTRILMIDDEKDFLEPVVFWLQSKNYDVEAVTSGKEGVEVIKKNPPDIVFLDIFMPGMNGVDTLAEIRKINKEIPVIMLTVAEIKNIKDAYSMKRLNELGVSGFFKKKDSFDELVNVLDITLRTHKKIKGSE